MGRSQSRERAFIFIFENQFHNDLSFEDMKALAVESELFEADGFTESLYRLTLSNLPQIDDEIRKYLKKWRLERLPKVTLAIIRLAVAEILYGDDTPAGVVANEAVNLTKKYATKEDASFVNGLLGSVIRNRNGDNASSATAAPEAPASDVTTEKTLEEAEPNA